jgi:lincosamide nucleotidyltransferase A/C/D/E
MTADGAAAVLARVEEHGVDVWLEGGWCIDALLGRQTREHDDLDVIVPLDQLPDLERALRGLGFGHGFAAGPLSFEVVDDDGRQVDVHPIALQQNGDWLYLMEDGGVWTYPAGSLAGRGAIAGRRVRCLTPDMALVCHSQGYALDEEHERDVAALCERYGLPLPRYRRA